MRNFDKTQIRNRKRTLSRLVAAQILYQYEFFNRKRDIEKLTDEIIDNYALFEDEKIKSYRKFVDLELINKIITIAIDNIEKIDDLIKVNLAEKAQIDRLSKQILRLGIAEILFVEDIDTSISITEYSDIAGCFFEGSQITTITFILNQIKND